MALWAGCCVQIADAQVNITVSKKKTVIDGKDYYLHTVRQGETLYSISKAYGVLQKDIVFSNPDSFEGIRVGQELKIPEKPESGNFQLESSQYIYHITKQGETVYALMQTYHISMEELYRLNPELENSPLQTGQVVTLPKPNPSAPPVPSKYLIHEVQRRETLFSIAGEHGVSINRLMEANPEIDPQSPGIKAGQKIKIPLPDVEPIGIPVEMSKADTIIIRKDAEADPVECDTTVQDSFHIALLLPFSLSDRAPADTSIKKDAEGRYVRKDGTYWIPPFSEMALEFYQGALLAIDSLKQSGLKAQIHTFDTSRDTLQLIRILNDSVMKRIDLIIGPFFTDMVDRVARFAAENHIFYVSPVATNIESVKNSPCLLQVNSGEINTIVPMTDVIARQRDSIRVVLIGNKSENDQSLFTAYQNKLQTILPDSMVTMFQFKVDSIQIPSAYLKKDKRNIVIVTAGNEAFINLVAAQLNASVRDYPIHLYGLVTWTNFINLDPEYLHRLEFHFATAYYVDYQRKEVLRFLQQYRKYYAAEPVVSKQDSYAISPVQYVFLGYDVMFYFCSLLKRYGREFGYCVSGFRLPTLQSDFRFTKVQPSGGYINTSLHVYKYTRDYRIIQMAEKNE
jgi:LysM repeat protein